MVAVGVMVALVVMIAVGVMVALVVMIAVGVMVALARRQQWFWVGSGDVYWLTRLLVILKHNNKKKMFDTFKNMFS